MVGWRRSDGDAPPSSALPLANALVHLLRITHLVLQHHCATKCSCNRVDARRSVDMIAAAQAAAAGWRAVGRYARVRVGSRCASIRPTIAARQLSQHVTNSCWRVCWAQHSTGSDDSRCDRPLRAGSALSHATRSDAPHGLGLGRFEQTMHSNIQHYMCGSLVSLHALDASDWHVTAVSLGPIPCLDHCSCSDTEARCRRCEGGCAVLESVECAGWQRVCEGCACAMDGEARERG